MLKNTTSNEATWMETLNYVSRRPYLPTTFYSFQFGSLSHEKNGFKVKVLFFKHMSKRKIDFGYIKCRHLPSNPHIFSMELIFMKPKYFQC